MHGSAYLLDKTRGITSRHAAACVASAWGFRKYGHAGTLDPDATGLLMVLLGKATKLSRFFVLCEKRYSFGIELGLKTDTDDTTGSILERTSADHIRKNDILKVLEYFTGSISQKVPTYSAVKINGVRAYKSARKGLQPNTPSREVIVSDWQFESYDNCKVLLSVTVSSGTYIRALARDIGNELGTGGAAFGIRRLSVGLFNIEEASEEYDNRNSMLDMAEIMRDHKKITISDADRKIVSHGGSIAASETGIVVLLDNRNRLVAVAEGDGFTLKSLCVLENC